MLTAVTAIISVIAVVIAIAGIVAGYRRSPWLLPIEVAQLALAVVLVALNIADRTWWLAALWVGCAALSVHTLRQIRRRTTA